MSNIYKFGRFELRLWERSLLENGAPHHLGGRAYDILVALFERRDRVVQFDELLDLVWPGLAVEENNLSVHISSLRKILGNECITTIRGRGYQFTFQDIQRQPSQRPLSTEIPFTHFLTPEIPGSYLAIFSNTGRNWQDSPSLIQHIQPNVASGACTLLDQSSQKAILHFPESRRCTLTALAILRTLSSSPQEKGNFQLGISCTSDEINSATDSRSLEISLGLAMSACPQEILATSTVADSIVSGIDCDLEDYGERTIAGCKLRIYRLDLIHESIIIQKTQKSPLHEVKPTIAVLPLEELAISPPNDLLGEAIADEIIGNLSKLAAYCVISSLSTRRIQRCGLTHQSTSNLLNARYLISGTYRGNGNQLALQISLQDLHNGAVLNTQHLALTTAEIFDPSSNFGPFMAGEINRAILNQTLEWSRTRPLPSLESYALLMGAIALMHRLSLQEFERARLMLEHLMQRPGCVHVATTWLAKWHVMRAAQGWSDNPSIDAQRALEFVGRSLSADSSDALALAIGGLVHAYLRKDLDSAGQMYDEAVVKNPSEPLGWLFKATHHAYLGRGIEATEASEHALRLSPLDPQKYFFDSLAGTAILAGGNLERAVALSRSSLRLNRMHASSWRTLAIASVMQDKLEEATSAIQQLLLIDPEYTVNDFRQKFPGRDGPMAEPWARALLQAGLPESRSKQ